MAGLAGRLRCLRPHALLVVLCLALYLPGIAAIPPLDRDEARFAQATRQMLESGDFLDIRFQDEARNKKPAGIYWLQAAAVSLVSSPEATAIWPYRLPSLLGAIAAVLTSFAFAAALFGERPAPRHLAVIAAVLLGSTLGVVAEAHIAKTDAALLFAITAAQAALGLTYVRSRTGQPVAAWLPIVFWAAEIAAIFLKGPVGPALAVVTAAALAIADGEARWLRHLHPFFGILAVIIAVTPWLIAIEYATKGRFVADALGGDLWAKLVGVRELHGAPPFSYLFASLATFWPGSLLIVPAMVRAWRRHDLPAERFLLAWLVPPWLILELVPTKLPHYVLPLYPALALLAAAALVDGARLPRALWERRIDLLARTLWGVATLGLAALLIGLPLRFADGPLAVGVIGAVLLLALATALLLYRARPGVAVGLIAALSLAFVVPAAMLLPRLDRLWLSRAALDLVTNHPATGGAPLVAVGYSEPSLVFLFGTKLMMTSPSAAVDALAAGGEALVSNRSDALFQQALSARGLKAVAIDRAAGLDYSNGQRMVLTLYRVARD